MRVSVVPWIRGRCSCYAIALDDIVLPEQFAASVARTFPRDAQRLAKFLMRLTDDSYIRPDLLRSELPNEGVFALYNHKPMGREPYNPIRLLCSYVADTNRILIVGDGFYKHHDRPIQNDSRAMKHARLVADVVRLLNNRIAAGEITVSGSELLPLHGDSLHF